MELFYDLHMHSCLSPCGDNDMTPNNIVRLAKLNGLDVIAVSDHNSAANLPAVFWVAEEEDLLVIPAIEVCTSEEIHVLTLYHDLELCMAFSERLYQLQPNIPNRPDIFGEQRILNEDDLQIGSLDKLLINASTWSLDELLAALPEYGGVAIPAHVDKDTTSILSVLGYIPPEYGFPCIEVKDPAKNNEIAFAGNRLSNSDAHYLEDIAQPVHKLIVEEKSPAGVISALMNRPFQTYF